MSKRKKIGRNSPCPCGSGKKFKRCHLGKIERLSGGVRFVEPIAERGLLVGRPFVGAKFRDKQAVAVGNVVYLRPADETFQEFLINHLKGLLGDSWLKEENGKIPADQHPLFVWIKEVAEAVREAMAKPKDPVIGAWAIKTTPNIKSLEVLAYDIFTLKHCANVLPTLIKRLKHRDQFQGARYEIAVAALAVRTGFNVEWINEKGKHCEFVGTHKENGIKVAFEAKSHRRDEVTDIKSARIKVGDHVKEAIEQAREGMPFVVFSDLTLPIEPDKPLEEKQWFSAIEASLRKVGTPDSINLKRVSAIFVTNFNWHLGAIAENELKQPFHAEVLPIVIEGASHPIAIEIVNLLKIASQQYGLVPPRLEDMGPTSRSTDETAQ